MLYDLSMLGILVFTTFRGSAKGIAWQLAAIASLVLCFLFATPLSLAVAPLISVDPPLNRWIAMLVIYLVFSFGCFGLARMFRSWLEAARFEEYDRHLGAMFGLVKGATICFVLTFFIVCLSQEACQYVLRTNSGYIAAAVMQQLDVVMPAELSKVLTPFRNRLGPAGPSAIVDREQEWSTRGEEFPSPPAPAAATTDRRDLASDWDFRGSTRRADDAFDDRVPRNPVPEPVDRQPRDQPAQSGPAVAVWMNRLSEALTSGLKERISGSLRDILPPAGDSTAGRVQEPGPRDVSPPQSAVTPPGPNSGADPATERQRLEHEIAVTFSSRPEQQELLKAEVDAALRGYPASVGLNALRDWRADLLGLRPDPDPETDLTTSLDDRLQRQAGGRR